MEIKWKRVISVFFGLAGILMLWIALFFNVYTCKIGGERVSVNGFDFLINDYYPEGLQSGEFIKTTVLVIFIVFFIELLSVFYSFFTAKKDLFKMIGAFVFFNFVLLLIYMISGFIFKSDIQKAFMKELSEDAWVTVFVDVKMKTFCYFPVVNVFVCMVLYFLLGFWSNSSQYVNEKDPLKREYEKKDILNRIESDLLAKLLSKYENKEKLSGGIVDNTDLLLKYKRLLDDSVITQEDFDRKKRELLN